jgi:hypothetical protein
MAFTPYVSVWEQLALLHNAVTKWYAETKAHHRDMIPLPRPAQELLVRVAYSTQPPAATFPTRCQSYGIGADANAGLPTCPYQEVFQAALPQYTPIPTLRSLAPSYPKRLPDNQSDR